jgi:hypothetical protein
VPGKYKVIKEHQQQNGCVLGTSCASQNPSLVFADRSNTITSAAAAGAYRCAPDSAFITQEAVTAVEGGAKLHRCVAPVMCQF